MPTCCCFYSALDTAGLRGVAYLCAICDDLSFRVRCGCFYNCERGLCVCVSTCEVYHCERDLCVCVDVRDLSL